MAVEFPAFLKLEYRSDNSAGSTMLADLDRALFDNFAGERHGG